MTLTREHCYGLHCVLNGFAIGFSSHVSHPTCHIPRVISNEERGEISTLIRRDFSPPFEMTLTREHCYGLHCVLNGFAIGFSSHVSHSTCHIPRVISNEERGEISTLIRRDFSPPFEMTLAREHCYGLHCVLNGFAIGFLSHVSHSVTSSDYDPRSNCIEMFFK